MTKKLFVACGFDNYIIIIIFIIFRNKTKYFVC